MYLLVTGVLRMSKKRLKVGYSQVKNGWNQTELTNLHIYVFWTGSLGLYFPQRMYTESIYVGQPQGSPVLQVHSMLESNTERPYFFLCSHRDTYASWFYMDEASGILSMNKTLEWSDFSSIREFDIQLYLLECFQV